MVWLERVAVAILYKIVYLLQIARKLKYGLSSHWKRTGLYIPASLGTYNVLPLIWLARMTGVETGAWKATWFLREDSAEGRRCVAYYGSLSQAELFWNCNLTGSLPRRDDVVLCYQGDAKDYDLSVLDSWLQYSAIYGDASIANLQDVFQILGWKCDMVSITRYFPYSYRECPPGDLVIEDLYLDQP